MRVLYYVVLKKFNTHLWFQKANLDKLNNRLL